MIPVNLAMEEESCVNRLYTHPSDLKGAFDAFDAIDESSSSVLSVKSFEHYKPMEGTEYFRSKVEAPKHYPTFIAGVVFYNEDVAEVKRTLNSLGEQLSQIRDACKTQAIIVGDGVKQMQGNTADYLFSIFCNTDEEVHVWKSMMEDLRSSRNKTYVIQRNIPSDNSLCCVKFGKYQYPLTLVLKSENRRKHNSQEWILNSFATQAFTNVTEVTEEHQDDFHSHYILMTDCGTLFESHCIYRLLRYLIKHPKCVGTTARQRVMTAEEQDLSEQEGWFSFAKYLRLVQLADYEVSYATYTGAFSAAGCLPVLPGPCAMFRYSGLLARRISKDIENGKGESALEHYNNLVDTSIHNTNICMENVKLAEDRIPSYAVVTHGEPGAYTTWVDGAVFKFQAETSLEKLILQRRRWINGALSCYVWNCLLHPGLIMGSQQNFFRKCLILLLYWLQFINYIFAMCTYGVMAGSLYISVVSLFDLETEIALTITVAYLFIVAIHFIVHYFYVFSRVLTHFAIVFNAVTLGFIVSGFVYEIIDWGGLSNYTLGRSMIVYSAIVIVSVPFVMALVSLNLKSAVYVLLSFIPYWLFLPTLVGTFVMYSVAR